MKADIAQPDRAAKPAEAPPLERFKPLMSTGEFARLQAELERPLPVSFRINTLKMGASGKQDLVGRYGWELQAIPFCATGWRFLSGEPQPARSIEHRLGEIYIQEAASMLPPELFDPASREPPLTLDMAASPGGKTGHLAALSSDKGLLFANDSSAGRVTALRLVLAACGCANTAVTNFPGEHFGSWFPETFDRVLLDAPCSMQGLRSSESHVIRPITGRERSALARRQVRLLISALQAVKVGGQVVYSTCTLEPEEDEGVLDAVMRQFAGSLEVPDITRKLTRPAPGLTKAFGQGYQPSIENAARLWPHIFGTSGFFAGLLVKTAPLPCQSRPAPRRPWEASGFAPLQPSRHRSLSLSLADMYGFDLDSLLESQGLSLWHRGGGVAALPDRLVRQFSHLPVVSAGLSLGEQDPTGFTISHEWASRFARQMPGGRVRLPEDLLPAWLRGEDLRGLLPVAEAGKHILLAEDEHGRFLGRARALPDRLKNLLPRRVVL